MANNFLIEIDDAFTNLKESVDSITKSKIITKFKNNFNIEKNQTIGAVYHSQMLKNKEAGVVYTPSEITQYMITSTIKPESIIENPFMKILDPSCGCGNFILNLFTYLKKIYQDNLKLINIKNQIILREEDIARHIIDNNLFGYDIDSFALKILFMDLFSISDYVNFNNFTKKDFLIEEINEKYDIIIGNPPYVGHKSVNREYCSLLKKKFPLIYKDKGDISYCFFEKSIDNLKNFGKISFITSRYFFEAPSGRELRKMISNECNISEIVDFYGLRPFKKVGIDPVIISLHKKKNRSSPISVIKPNIKDVDIFLKSIYSLDKNYCNVFLVNNKSINADRWLFCSEEELTILHKIEAKCSVKLGDICESSQGIITGCDKAFVVDESIIKAEGIERSLLKPWIKNSCINKNCIKKSGKYIIYSDFIDDECKFPNAIRHIGKFKDKLLQRRECKKGIRDWYKLQWGRRSELFEEKKVVYPYKANSNRFALDIGSYFSADVYSFMIKNHNYDYEYLIYLLNSCIYEFYFKCIGKKLGNDLYDYYPNKIMQLPIPDTDISFSNDEKWICDYFGLTNKEVNLISEKIC